MAGVRIDHVDLASFCSIRSNTSCVSWTSDLTSLYLCFLIYKIWMTAIPTFRSGREE
jgi:hypothetical protein